MLQCSVSCGSGIKQRSVVCRNESGDPSFECSGEKPTETEACHSKCVHVQAGNLSPVGWERIGNSSGDLVSEDHTIVIQDEYNDDLEEEADTNYDASESVKTIVGTNPK